MTEARGDRAGCPNCSAEMDGMEFEGLYRPSIELDLCFPCHVLWLDRRESLQLAPRGILDLFNVLYEHRDDPRHNLQARLRCPRCRRPLSLSHDIGKGGRFSYYRCPERHGRLTPFSEFLKEKQFVRSLTPAEKHRLRSEIKQVRCSSCGAPVDLADGFACGHCGAPLTVLDPEAVEKTLRELEQADAGRTARRADPEAAAARARAVAALEALRADREGQDGAHLLSFPSSSQPSGVMHDLLSISLGRLLGRP